MKRLRKLFRINLRDGKLFWKNPPNNHSQLRGKEAGFPRRGGSGKLYWIIKINGRPCYRSHLIFLAKHGRYPNPLIDHRDGDSLNDRPRNLRDATITQNAWNHKRRKRRINLPMGIRTTSIGRYQARISFHGEQIHLGAFDTVDQARAIYLAKRKELYGEFA